MVKKMMTILLTLILNSVLTAPATSYCYVTEGTVLNIADIPYLTFAKRYFKIEDPLLKSMVGFESNFDIYAVNPYSGARGILQYMKVMIDEANKIFRITHPQNQSLIIEPEYTLEDAFNPYKSIEMYWLIMDYKNPEYYPDKAIRIWFGVGVQKPDGMRWEDYYNSVTM